MASVVSFEVRDGIGIISVDSPPVNALGRAVRLGLMSALTRGLGDPEVKAFVLSCKGRTFIAGADITEFGKPPEPPFLPDVIEAYEASPKPVVAALFGTALGGGLEVALGCHYRVATPGAKCGLPEVRLGLIPGAGGTQRLPRLIGVEKALQVITSGEPMDAEEAKRIGLIDEIASGPLLDAAVRFADRIKDVRPLPRIRDRAERVDPSEMDAKFFEDAERRLSSRARGARAPLRCLEAVRASVELTFDEGLEKERALFLEAASSEESAALRHVFFAERTAAKVPDVPSDTPIAEVEKAAVIGAGTMGAGIAMVFANAGIRTTLIDREQQYLDRALGTIRKNYESTVKKGKLSEAEMGERLGRIDTSTDVARASDSDLVIEAVFEEMELKKDLMRRLDAVCKPSAILATNTSTLDVDEIAQATRRPAQVIGLHFFSPANVMRLLEVVRGDKTSKPVVATSMRLAKKLGKVGVLVRVCYGFVGNRMLHQYYREANFVIQEGALPEQVDRVMTKFGMAMGPCATSDLAGIDVGYRIRKAKGPPPPGERYFGAVPDRLAELGRYGQKTAKGFYRYESGSRTPIADPEVEGIIAEVSRALEIERRPVPDTEILERCLFALINEGARILEEGVALRASDIDTIWINGYGFPPHRGGPMFHADLLGPKKVYERLLELEKAHGSVFRPAELLARLAREGKTFASLDAAKSG